MVFDLLTRPRPELTTVERDEVKKVARRLLKKLRSVLTADWRKTAMARARVQDAIEEALDERLPRAYSPEVSRRRLGRCSSMFVSICGGRREARGRPRERRACMR